MAMSVLFSGGHLRARMTLFSFSVLNLVVLEISNPLISPSFRAWNAL